MFENLISDSMLISVVFKNFNFSLKNFSIQINDFCEMLTTFRTIIMTTIS